MTINFGSLKPLRPVVTAPSFKSEHHHTCPECGQVIHDDNKKVESEKKGFMTKAKDKFIGVRKFFIDLSHITAGTLKGAFWGALTGFGVAGAVAVRNLVKKAPTTLGTGGKILAGVAAVGVMAGNIFKSKLDANEAKAKLDHRWETGHNE